MNNFDDDENDLLIIFNLLREDSEKKMMIDILQKLLSNLAREPNNETFKKLKKSNKTLCSFIFNRSYILKLLNIIGFFELDIDGEQCLLIFDVDIYKIQVILRKIDEIKSEMQDKYKYDNNVKDNLDSNKSNTNSVSKNNQKDLTKSLNKADDYKEVISVPQKNPNIALNLLKETANIRKNMIPQTPINTEPRNLSSVRLGNMTNQSIVPEFYQNNKSVSNSEKGKLNNPNELIGKRCLDLTNEFRKMNKLDPLKWEDHIWNISYSHSKSMGDKLVRFSHDGFEDRIKKYPYGYSTACENIYMCSGVNEDSISENAVNGWINSPGHKKNLLSDTTSCAIATYRNSSGEYYLTQIFFR